jgi:type VI secretion system protein ImpE
MPPPAARAGTASPISLGPADTRESKSVNCQTASGGHQPLTNIQNRRTHAPRSPSVGSAKRPFPTFRILNVCKLDEALAALSQQIRAQPADAKLRVFLFQLLSVQGQWDRALTQLNVAGEMDAAHLAMVQTYREGIRCELLRADIFAGKRSPLIFGEPDEWVALLMQALKLTAEGNHAAAASLRERAFEAAPAIGGTIAIQGLSAASADAGVERQKPKNIEHPFEWLADADSRLGPVIEAVVNGRYYWVPLHRIRQIEVEAPADLRDVIWTPVRFVWANGGDVVGLIPTRYAGSEKSGDALVRLARKTDWQELSPGVFAGLGQRVLATDSGEYSLMDVRQMRLNPPAA